MTTHYPEHMASCKAQGTLVLDGKMFVVGDAHKVLAPEHLRDAYGIDVAVMEVDYRGHGLTVCQPLMDGWGRARAVLKGHRRCSPRFRAANFAIPLKRFAFRVV